MTLKAGVVPDIQTSRTNTTLKTNTKFNFYSKQDYSFCSADKTVVRQAKKLEGDSLTLVSARDYEALHLPNNIYRETEFVNQLFINEDDRGLYDQVDTIVDREVTQVSRQI